MRKGTEESFEVPAITEQADVGRQGLRPANQAGAEWKKKTAFQGFF
jgi:hypothetical protein